MHIREQINRISKKLSGVGDTEFVLDDRVYFPHITLYSPGYPEKNVRKVMAMARHMAQRFSEIELRPKVVSGTHGYVMMSFERTPQLGIFHEAALKVLNPLREGHLLPRYRDESYFEKLPEEAQRFILEYGHPRVLSAWAPHMTLARFKDENVAMNVINNVSIRLPKFMCDEVAVFSMGEHGTCVEPLGVFKLSTSFPSQ